MASRTPCSNLASSPGLTSIWAISRIMGGTSLILLGLPRRLGAEGMSGIDPEDLELAGYEIQLVQRQRQRARARMSLDVGVELGRGELAAHHVAFELGHVDAVGGEAAQRLIERRRHVAHVEDEGGDRQASV